jgi:hypothetical protein
MLQWLYTCVSSVCSKCFIYITCTLQVFHLDVAKVDLDVAYTCMLQAYVSSVSGVSYTCCKCFIRMLHMFAMTFKCFPGVLQVFQTYIANVSSGCCKSRASVAHVAMGSACRSHLLQLLGDVQATWVCCWGADERAQTGAWDTERRCGGPRSGACEKQEAHAPFLLCARHYPTLALRVRRRALASPLQELFHYNGHQHVLETYLSQVEISKQRCLVKLNSIERKHKVSKQN